MSPMSPLVYTLPAIYHGLKALSRTIVRVPEHFFTNPAPKLIDFPDMEAMFIEDPGIRRDIKVLGLQSTRLPAAVGSNTKIWCNNEAFIHVNIEMMNIEPEGMRFFMRKEVRHIKTEFPITSELIKCIASLAGVIFSQLEERMFGVSFPIPTIFISRFIVDRLYSTKKDNSAFDFALQTATVDELKGALNVFDAIAKVLRVSQKLSQTKAIENRLRELGIRAFGVNKEVSKYLYALLK